MGDEGASARGHRKTGRPYLVGSVFGVIAFLVLLTVLGYVNSRLEVIERQLTYTPPAVAGDAAGGVMPERVATGQTVYVPVYSHIYSSGGQAFLLETTLSVRNTDPKKPITLTAVRYYDTAGSLMKKYVTQPLSLAPLASVNFVVEERDTRGGSGANFIVEWVAETEVSEPVIEAVMVGISRTHNISFVRPGRVIKTNEP